MKIIEKSTITTNNNGTFDVQLEDWSQDYPDTFMPGNVLAAYPIAKEDSVHPTPFAPKRNEKFRCAFWFPNGDRAMEAYKKLLGGEAELVDYISYIERLDYVPCVTGERGE